MEMDDYRNPRLTPTGQSDEEMLKFIEEITSNCDEVQKKVLAEILTQNGETEYLQRYGLAGSTDRDNFKKKIPLVTYQDLLSDIKRIANGDDSAILSGKPASELYESSGTSAGKCKMIPTTKEEVVRRLLFVGLFLTITKKYFPGMNEGKMLYFMFAKSETKTSGGLPISSLTTRLYNSYFKVSGKFNSPAASISCSDIDQSMYIQMLCALINRFDIILVGAVMASGLLRAIRFLYSHWRFLANDIAVGKLSPSITDLSLRISVEEILRPDPLLSQFISDQCSDPEQFGIVARIWPNAKFINTIITGAMAQYIPTLQSYIGDLPLISAMYSASECSFGLNLTPICPPSEVVFTIMPNMGYFEFLPLDSDQPVDLAGVDVGKEYEIIATTYTGLNRYRVGDILRVSGFHNSAPQFKFVRCKNVVLSIDSDKTDETDLQRAVERASNLLAVIGLSVAEYTSHAYTKEIPGHYVIYLELFHGRNSPEMLPEKVPERETMEKCCLEMEESLDAVYREFRVVDRSIGPLEIRVVRPGSFEHLMYYAVSRGASIDQYKVPRCIISESMLEILDSRVESAHFSPNFPHWSPDRFT